MIGRETLDKQCTNEQEELFLQRSVQVFWLGIGFYILFALLDYLVHRDLFPLFFTYRLVFVCFLLVCLALLYFQSFRRYVHYIMAVALIAASWTISLMTVPLGGFSSGYYLGIVLVVAFVLSVLPLRVSQVVFLGSAMYLTYVITLLVAKYPLPREEIVLALNNTSFYCAIFLATIVKSYDDGKLRQSIWKRRKALVQMQEELNLYSGNLEQVVEQRVKQIEELEFRYSELYENIRDMVVVVSELGNIFLYNRRFAEVFLQGKGEKQISFFSLLIPEKRRSLSKHLLTLFVKRQPLVAVEVEMAIDKNVIRIVEMRGDWVDLDEYTSGYQLVLRDITHRREMELQVLESTRLIDKSRRTAILGLAKLAEYRDKDTGSHLERIREYTRLLTRELAKLPGLQHLVTPSFLEDIILSSVLHDIGKVGISDAILLKPGRLTAEEFAKMKQHTVYGSDVLAEAERDVGAVSFLTMGQEIAHFHHEKWDGSGYPLALAGVDIPLSARIVALADVYDALTSKRCYKKALTHEEARTIILESKGRHFDPEVVDAFLKQERQFKQIRMDFLLQ